MYIGILIFVALIFIWWFFFRSDLPGTGALYIRTGSVPSNCPDGYSMVGDQCYSVCSSATKTSGIKCLDACPSDYNVGQNIETCVRPEDVKMLNIFSTQCPTGYNRNGAICTRPVSNITRPFTERNPTKPICSGGEDSINGMCYPECNDGYYSMGTASCYQY
jgi:hypothetical protein